MARPRKTRVSVESGRAAAPAPAPEIVERVVDRIVHVPTDWSEGLVPTDAKRFAEELLSRFRDKVPEATFDTIAQALLIGAWADSKRTGARFVAARLVERIDRARKGLGL